MLNYRVLIGYGVRERERESFAHMDVSSVGKVGSMGTKRFNPPYSYYIVHTIPQYSLYIYLIDTTSIYGSWVFLELVVV